MRSRNGWVKRGARMRYRQQQRAGGGRLPAALGGEAGQSLAADACKAIVMQVQAPAGPQRPGSMIQASGKSGSEP